MWSLLTTTAEITLNSGTNYDQLCELCHADLSYSTRLFSKICPSSVEEPKFELLSRMRPSDLGDTLERSKAISDFDNTHPGLNAPTSPSPISRHSPPQSTLESHRRSSTSDRVWKEKFVVLSCLHCHSCSAWRYLMLKNRSWMTFVVTEKYIRSELTPHPILLSRNWKLSSDHTNFEQIVRSKWETLVSLTDQVVIW